MMRTGWNCYCFFCALVCAILKLTSATTNCSVTNNQTRIHEITCYVSENVSSNTLVYDAKEDDRFSDTSNLQFQVHNTGFETAFIQHFVVNNSEVPWVLDNGELRTRGSFDREEMFGALSDSQNRRDTITWAPLLVIRSNGGGVWRFQLRIKVVDINDNIPTFPQSATVIEHNEGDGNNVTFFRFLFAAIDNDERHNSVQDYILQDDYDGLFTLVVRVGPVVDTVRLESTSPLDYETQSRYDLIMIARDGGNQTGTLNVTLIVLDVNDNRPVVGITQYDVAVMENLNSGHPVIDINATDADSGDFGTLKYSMRVQNDVGSDVTSADIFFINRTTGEILTDTVLDREDVEEYHLVVTIRDCGDPPYSVIVNVDVEVIDTNDNPPVVRVDLNELTGGKVRENTPVGTSIATMTVSDPDEGVNKLFTVEALLDLDVEGGSQSQQIQLREKASDTWDLVLANSLDRETRENYNLQITVTDQGSVPLSTTKNFSFSLHDINDNAPLFNASYRELVSEGTAINHTIIQGIRAYDRDIGTNAELRYSLSPNNAEFQYQHLFSIHRITGDLMVAGSLDRETVSELDVLVIVTDKGVPALSGNTTVHLVLTDVNDNQPIFVADTATQVTISENLLPRNIYNFSANDPDLPPYANVTYSIMQTNFFRINATTGQLYTTRELDREDITVHHLQIGASDNLLLPRYINFSVIVGDVNDVTPRFIVEQYFESVPENASINSVVARLQVEDPDLDNRLRFLIESGNDEGKFSVIGEGDVVVAASLDRETTESYTLMIGVTDGANNAAATGARVVITVLDINDHPPQFNQSSYTFNVTEELETAVTIGTVSAFSNDAGQNGIVSYQITGGNDDHYFTIHSSDGIITAGTGIDRELNERFELTITARDGGRPPLPNTTTVTVIVRDINDNRPVFNPTNVTINLREDHSLMQPFYSAGAVDVDEGDNANTTYSIVSQSYGNFSINPNTGALSLVSTLDFEMATSVLVVIEAADRGQSQFTDRLYLNISVEDIDDRLPRFQPNFPTSVSVNESALPGHVILKFQAIISPPSEAREFEYSISDHMGNFTLSISDNYEASIEVISLDREVRSRYSLNVTIINTIVNLRNSKLLEVIVTDTNDNPPTFNMSEYTFEVMENSVGAEVGTVVADDSDDGENSMINFAFQGASDSFHINPETGRIETLVSLDYDTVTVHNLMVLATDMGNPSISTSATVSISVIDVNDNPPRFSRSQEYEFSVREDDSVGTIVGTIVATDVDSGNFGALTYAIEEGDSRNHFSIIQEGGNGMITVSAALDRESVEEYTLVISVSDNNGIPLYHNINGTFTITVTDVNDNAPVFSSMQVYAAIVPENEADHLIATITANDADTEARSMVSYKLGFGNYNNAFSINPSSGELRAKLLDYEANIFYPLEVIALDGGSPARRSVQVFNITVANVNDHTPQFALPFYEFSVREGPSSTSVTMTVQAVDGDLGVMGEVMYRITSQVPDADFEIDSTSGEITAARQLNYEHHSQYELVVEAVDMDQNEANRRRSSTIVRVVVENINDNRPSFLNLPYTIWLSESVSVNTIAYVASAVDADTNTLQYSIAGGNQDNKFTVNSQTGEVFVSSSLDRDVISRYDLTIIVTDGSLVDTGVLTVEVEDVNDNAPVFSLSPYTISVSEGANVGDVAGRIIAADADEGLNGQLEYSLVEASEYFSIDGSSGNLTLLAPLDRDNGSNPNPVTLRVKVTDKGIINRNSNTSLVEVNVTDINDNLPVFTRSTYRFTISRDFRVGMTIGVVNATDADEGSNAEHVFDIVQNPHGLELFSMNQTSGELSLKGSLEMGSLPLYWIRVRARDLNRFESFASVEIVVTDVNDSPPFFPQEEYSVELMESVDTPRLILPLSATDSDSGMNSFISYEFGEAQPNFTINESTGDIELTDSLDHERRSFFTLLVYAVNRNGRNGSTIVHVNVVDVNDNIPEFQNLPTSLTISEVPYTGLEILHVVAMDPDSGSFGQVSYSLVTEAARSQFSIDNVTGVVTNLVELTASTTHVLELEATDGGGESRRANITLTVADHSSQSPDFSRESISLMIPENYPVNTVFHQFNASNRLTSPAFIQYRISNFSDEAFALNQTTGELMLNNSLDFEQEESYYFIIESFQEVSNTRYSTYLEVVILVEDVNDNAPVFNETYTVVTDIRESIGMNQVIVNLDADDADFEDNGQVNYEITEGNVGEVFSIAPTTGQIIVVRSLDRESVSAYRLVVTATDEGTPPLSATAVVDIGISDDNDVTPSFRNASYVFRVSENSTLHSVVGVVSAVDPDLTPLQLHYIISSLTASLDGAPVEVISLTSFEVNRSSGEILLNHNLNRGQVDKFELQVDATDGINTNSTNVTIIVQDANNNRPVFDSAGAIHTVIIPELSGIGTPVFQFTATDADFGRNGIVQYRLGNDWPSGQFEIDPVTGIVTLLHPAPLYQVSSNGLWVTGTVVASDVGDIPLNSSITVRINLRDINNHPPSLSPSYNGSVFNIEDVGTEVLSITAGDQDKGANEEVSYYISHTQGPISVPFSIAPTTGRITVSGELTPGNEIFTVIAINEDPDPFATHFILSSTATVEIRVNRMNRYYPQFNQTVYHGLVLESEDAGTNIVQVYATDDDEDTTISYSIQSSVAVPFAINANGLLSVNGELDRETTNMYSITIVATDDGVPPKTATARVRINIIDVNDNEPTFMHNIFEASITENVPKGTEVTTITASDTDLLENAAITYRLNDTSVFNISTQTGRIYSIGSIDRESVAMYYLQIIATDNGNPVQSSSAVILVTVNGENEFEPRFNDSQETFFPVPSGLVAGSIVGRLVAYDDDQGKEGELKFTFLSYEGSIDPKNFFYINSSGFIILNVSAQEMRNSASSSRRKRQTDETNVTPIVTIVEVEDSGATSQSDELRITLSLHNSYIPESPIVEGESDNSTILVVIASIVIAVVIIVIIIIVVLGCVYLRWRRHGKGKLQLYSPAAQSDADSTRPSIVSFTTSNANGIAHGDARAETGTRQTTVPEAGHAQVSTTSDSEPASGIFGDDESESVSGMQSRARANNPEHVSPNGRHRSPQHSRPPPISRSTSDLAAVVNSHNSNGFLRRTDDEEAHPYTRDQLIAIYAANANLLTNSPSQDSIHMFGSEGGGEADGDIDMDNYMFAKFAGGLDSADEESVVGMNNDAYTVSSRGRSSIASRSSAGAGIDEGPEDLWRGSRQGFRPHRVTDVIDEMHAVLSQESLSQSKEKRKPKPPHTMQFQETSFTKKPPSGSYTRHTGSMQNVRYPEHHIGNSQYEGYDGRRSSKSHYASSGAIYPLSYSSRASELTLPPYRAGEAPPPYATELSPPLRTVNPAEMRRGSQSSDSDSLEYPAPNPAASYGPQPISPQPSLPTTNSTMSLDNPIFQSPYSNKHFKVAKGVMPHPHSGSVPQINMYNAGSVHGNSIGQGLDRPQRYNVNNGNLRA